MGTYKQSIFYLRTKKLKYFENYFIIITTNLLSESVMIKVFGIESDLRPLSYMGHTPLSTFLILKHS